MIKQREAEVSQCDREGWSELDLALSLLPTKLSYLLAGVEVKSSSKMTVGIL